MSEERAARRVANLEAWAKRGMDRVRVLMLRGRWRQARAALEDADVTLAKLEALQEGAGEGESAVGGEGRAGTSRSTTPSATDTQEAHQCGAGKCRDAP